MGRTLTTSLVAAALASALLSCGPSPAAPSGAAPTGTLVVVVRDGDARVPFQPKVARILRAGEQLAARLGHAIQVEVDGSLLPQDHEGAQDVLARLVETVARDVDLVAKEEPEALDMARTSFERLVVRYAPAEAAEHSRSPGRSAARFDAATRTIDVVRGEARELALEKGEVARELVRVFAALREQRYARVLPDALPRAERQAWFAWHARGRTSRAGEAEPYAVVGGVNALRVRGMVMLAARDGDVELGRDARAWLVRAARDFAHAYQRERAALASAPPASPFRVAEARYVGWLRAELPRMTRDERAAVAGSLWPLDLGSPGGAEDRFAADAFPGLDRMAFVLAAIDDWRDAARPPRPREHGAHPLFAGTFCPRVEDTSGRDRRPGRRVEAGRCDGLFYRWVVADAARETALADAVLARPDVELADAVFHGTMRAHHGKDALAAYLRFLRRFEAHPSLWNAGASLLDDEVYRPDPTLLDEMRRVWRTSTSPALRATALFWFARHADGSYEPAKLWPDLLQGSLADDATLAAFFARGRATFEGAPSAWPALARDGGRARAIAAAARPLLGEEEPPRAGRGGVVHTLVEVGRLLCEEHALAELAELRAFAEAELASHPGRGLSDVVATTDPTACARSRPAMRAPRPPPPRLPRRPEPGPVKPDLPEDER